MCKGLDESIPIALFIEIHVAENLEKFQMPRFKRYFGTTDLLDHMSISTTKWPCIMANKVILDIYQYTGMVRSKRTF